MAQPIVEESLDSMDNLDFTLTSQSIQQPSSPTDETNSPIRYDYNTYESFYEIDVADFNISLYPDQLFRDLFDDIRSTEQYCVPSPIVDDICVLAEGVEVLNSTESNDVTGPIQSTDEHLAMIKSNDSTLPVIRPQMEKLPAKGSNDQSIALSNSVAVTVPTRAPTQLQLSHPLEDTYRPRYKSDYFPQKGPCRRPRYVADSAGNHFVQVQMPAEYHHSLKTAYIRVALLTAPMNDRGYFYSPYKFQTHNEDVRVPDQNPMYLPLEAHRGSDGILIFHLVLIKSKLDQLRHAQPLKPFSDDIGKTQNIITGEKLSPKELINKYQLDKSCIAFTLCTKLLNGTYAMHSETTVISSVITESPTKTSAVSKEEPEASTANPGKTVSCPRCAHCFDIPNDETMKKGSKRKSNCSTSRTSSKTTTNDRMNKKKKN